MSHPYKTLPEKAFWRPAVSSKNMFEIEELWEPKFNISRDAQVTTFGSCFAQHIGRALRQRGFKWLITEKRPEWLSDEDAEKFNFDIFSARTANIYTASLLRQWTSWALNLTIPSVEVWQDGTAFYDPFRPAIEPGGFSSRNEMLRSREAAIRAFERCIIESDYFVFTMGLTESWLNSKSGVEYPMCPGTAAGKFDASVHHFVNQDYNKIYEDMIAAITSMKTANPRLRFILTVSPVALTATNSGEHVAVATMYSKSVLRAVAGRIRQEIDYVDYFPSYEIINSPIFKGSFFQPDGRSVSKFGVNFVMDYLFRSLANKFGVQEISEASGNQLITASHKREVCEEEMLQAFG
ncbi:GSCFA family protein [Methylorubrum extorquens]